MMDTGLTSIVVPMRDAGGYVSQALASILRERRIPLEAVVVDDHSSDGSLAQVASLSDERIRVVGNSGRGIAACLNTGLAAARGSIIMRCDADDLYPETRIFEQVSWLQNHPGYDALCGAYATIDSSGNLVADLHCGAGEADITTELGGGVVRTHLCTFAMRSSLIRKVGGFRDYFETAEDTDFQLRLGEAGRIFFMPQRFYLHRLHNSSITHTQPTDLRYFFSRAAFEFQRQRIAVGLDDLQKGCPPPTPQSTNVKATSAREQIQGMLLGRAWSDFHNGKTFEAFKTAGRAAMTNPLDVGTLKSLIAMVRKLTWERH
jgi:glycosyltransferase involved in cell wall biosynthesis